MRVGIFRRKASKDKWIDPVATAATGHEGLPQLYSGTDPAQAPPGGQFRLHVEDVFAITGRGKVATGKIEAGSIGIGAQVEVISPDGSVAASTVQAIEASRQKRESAQAGESVGLLLSKSGSDLVQRGSIIATPGSVSPGMVAQTNQPLNSQSASMGHGFNPGGNVPSMPLPPLAPLAPVAAGDYVQVEIRTAPTMRMAAIKTLRDRLGLGIKDARALVDAMPCVVPIPMSRVDAEALVLDLGALGALAVVHG